MPLAYLRCMCYLLITCFISSRFDYHLCVPLAHLSTLLLLLSDLAVILILSSYSPDASYLPYLPIYLVFTFACSRSPSSMTPLHSTYCVWLISYPFDFVFFAVNAYIADAALCRFLQYLRISIPFYDSILVYLYKYCTSKANIASDLVSFVNPGH